MAASRRAVLFVALALFVIWSSRNFGRVLLDDNGLIVYCLGTILSLMILVRHKPREQVSEPPRMARLAALGVGGTFLALCGIVFGVHQFEWLGIVLMLYACLRWSLPSRYGRDLLLALFVLYWANPLPTAIIGKMQLLMQHISVTGSEWVLQWINVRVWADGLVLWMGAKAFGVPEACSGLRTASAVLVCTLGASVLFRFRWFETLCFLAAGVLQVLLMNIARISFMVVWAPRMPPEWAENFLHDTLGILLLISILAIQIEAAWWKTWSARRRRYREGVARGELETPDKATVLPRLWQLAFKWLWLLAVVAFVAGALAAIAWRHRPAHRAAMIADVAESLIESHADVSERAIDAALRFTPDDTSLRQRRSRILARRGKFDQALAELDTLGALSTADTVLRSWLLLSLDRLDEAVALVNSLPADARDLPAVAMVRAEYACRQNDADEASRNLLRVGKSHLFMTRVRSLYPYLALHEQWRTIAAVDGSQPYRDVTTALIAVHAFLKSGDMSGAADALKRAMARWPEDVRFLNPLFLMSMERPGPEWEARLTVNLNRNLAHLGADELATAVGYAFRIGRADLAWIAFSRLRAVDPTDPSLQLAVAQYGASWFRFRKHEVGLEDRDKFATVDVRPLFLWSRNMRELKPLWDRVPVVDELARKTLADVRAKYLDAALDEFARRDAQGALPERMELEYPLALAVALRYDDAHRRWNELERKYPGRRAYVALQRARLYDAQARWQESYEESRRYLDTAESPAFTAVMLQINALINLGFGEYALEVAEDARRVFPGAPQLDNAVAAIWDVYGFKEEALFALVKAGSDLGFRSGVQLLQDTGRWQEARTRAAALGVKIPEPEPGARQPMVLPPAEMVVGRRWPAALPDAEMDRLAAALRKQAASATSPFVRGLFDIEAQWHASRGGGGTSDPARWRAAGRSKLEQMSALKRLAMLLARQAKWDEAAKVINEAVALAPRSPMLRRIAVAISEGERKTVDAGYAAHPQDPYLWLAWLVTRLRAEGPGTWLEQNVSQAAEKDLYSPGATVRAGDLLLRQKLVKPATVLARDALDRARGLLPAYVLGMQCALAQNDMRWALSCALAGAERAADPVPFFRVIVQIKSSAKTVDPQLLEALEYLKLHSPSETEWGERLGQAYFEKGDAKRALTVFSEVMADDAKNVRVKTLLMAAEAARLQGETPRAVEVLEAAHANYPQKVSVLNNLIYVLAQSDRTLPRAKGLLPDLLSKAGDMAAVLDTAAFVYLRSGELDRADEYIQKALDLVKPGEYGVAEMRLNAAEIRYRLGRYEEARRQLDIVRSSPEVSEMVEASVRSLQDRLRDLK